jgi:hypothetical protein
VLEVEEFYAEFVYKTSVYLLLAVVYIAQSGNGGFSKRKLHGVLLGSTIPVAY